MTAPRRRLLVPLAAAAAVLAAAPFAAGVLAASPFAAPRPMAQSGGAAQVQVLLTNDGCVPSPDSVAAGPVSFSVQNTGGDRVTEIELLRDELIVGEKENLAPGFTGTFSVNLGAGDYQVYCPGATSERAPFRVAATDAASPNASVDPRLRATFDAAAAAYRSFVQQEAGQLVVQAQALADAVKAGDVERARALYGPARLHYERIERIAEQFGSLDAAIDMRADDADAETPFTGFHRLEQALWQDGRVDGVGPTADKLVADTQQLQQLVNEPSFQIGPAQIANGSAGLLDEVARTKITGEEERYSRLDLLDMSANVEGARRGFELLQPGLSQLDPGLSDTISARFAALETTMSTYRQADGWRSYDQLAPADVRALSQAANDLAEPLSQVAGRVVVAVAGS